MRESLSKKYHRHINTLNDFSAIFSSPDRSSVDLTCVKYEIRVIGKEILKDSDKATLNIIYSMINDTTGEIKEVWKIL